MCLRFPMFPVVYLAKYILLNELAVTNDKNTLNNLTLYVPCIMFQCVDKPTRYNTSYE